MRKTRRSAIALALAAIALAAAPAARASDCVTKRPSNGTGYRPGSSAGSLPSGSPRPGPEILHRPAPRAPQLENTGTWQAPPIMVSGARAYREGEFVYQDFLYDDTALAYPDEPKVYGANAADLVELRLKPLAGALAIRLTYNTMLDPTVAATTIALGSSDAPRAMPYDAGASMPAQAFVTVHGCAGDAVSAGDGKVLTRSLGVSIDRERRQVEVRVPYGAFDPRGRRVRVGAATGLWDAAAGKYRRPDSGKPAFYNVAFRFDEPFTGFRDSAQNAALSGGGDLSAFSASVDFVKLASGSDDDSGVPKTGKLSRIYASHFETAQGRGSYAPDALTALYPGPPPCRAPCSPQYAGQLQPYGVYVPDRPAPPRWRLALFHHGCGENYNTYIERAARLADLDGGQAIAVTTESRSACIWEFDQAGADLFEVWADVARNYRLDPRRVTLSGQSLGGYATWKDAVQWPELWSAAGPMTGPPAAALSYTGPPAPVQERTLVYSLLPSLRHVPVVHWVGMEDEAVPYTATQRLSDMLDALGYRHSFRAFTGEHGITGEFVNRDAMGEYIANREVVRNPAHVSYVFSGFMHQPEVGLTSDHAYWLSGLRLRDVSGDAPTGTIEAFSHGLGLGDAPAGAPQRTAGLHPTTVGGAPDPYHGVDLTWGEAPKRPKSDTLDIKATNLRSVTVNVARAGLTCHPKINVDSDGPLEVKLHGC